MSTFLLRLNQIKANCDVDWLTPSQQLAWASLNDRLILGEPVNLYGPTGSGKTFLAWLLVKKKGAVYLSSIKDAPAIVERLPIIDNHPPSRESYRETLKGLAFRRHYTALIISQTAILDDCYRIHLPLTQSDISCVYERFLAVDPSLSQPSGGSLHHLVNPDLPLNGREVSWMKA